MDAQTRRAYETHAREWHRSRTAERAEVATELARDDANVLDLGCGPGFHLPHLGDGAIGIDAAAAMLAIAKAEFHHPRLVQADLERLPFASGSASGAWASKSYVHITADRLPGALHDAHRVIEVRGRFILRMFCGDHVDGFRQDDQFGVRHFTLWKRELLEALIVGAGFEIVDHTVIDNDSIEDVEYDLRRDRTLADTVGPDMRVLLVGLNPSLHAADAGVGFVGPSNRFWRAAVESELITEPKDPHRALLVDRVGMTDLVKRATKKAGEISKSEFRAGLQRLELMTGLLQPEIVCVVGVTGWRAATGEPATIGPQTRRLGGCRVYVMPNPSGLNAHTNHEDLVAHFRLVQTKGSDPFVQSAEATPTGQETPVPPIPQ